MKYDHKIRILFREYFNKNLVKGELHEFLPGLYLNVTLKVTLEEQEQYLQELFLKYAPIGTKYAVELCGQEIVNFQVMEFNS